METELVRTWRAAMGDRLHLALTTSNVDDFPGLAQGFTPSGLRLLPDPDSSFIEAGPAGLYLRVDGNVIADDVPSSPEILGQVDRHLDLARQAAEHVRFELDTRLRGRHRSVEALWNTIDLYCELGINDIYLNATEAGSYLWARCGFDFASSETREEVVEVAQELLDHLGFEAVLDRIEHSWDFFDLEGETTFRDLVRAYEAFDFPLDDLADLAPDDADVDAPIPLSRALLRVAPHDGWRGHFDLRPQSRNYVQLQGYSRASGIRLPSA